MLRNVLVVLGHCPVGIFICNESPLIRQLQIHHTNSKKVFCALLFLSKLSEQSLEVDT